MVIRLGCKIKGMLICKIEVEMGEADNNEDGQGVNTISREG